MLTYITIFYFMFAIMGAFEIMIKPGEETLIFRLTTKPLLWLIGAIFGGIVILVVFAYLVTQIIHDRTFERITGKQIRRGLKDGRLRVTTKENKYFGKTYNSTWDLYRGKESKY